ncbi:MAG TPA: DUF72 domain-containing protein [Brevundimonas sp.]|jgi:uncharacterized protein YecE (DUF72 family)|uniref:DUF72 domain-containing protein n=1 Tax=Brevundimonas sp. TaxID=1871086 RepID=UPI002EDA7C42
MAPFDLRLGTAGWSIPAAVSDRFHGTGSSLERYAAVMNAAEINSSFHRPHRRTTYERWAASTPNDFRFSAKVPKVLTHDQRLATPEESVDRFANEVAGLGGKLAVILVQLPPSLNFDPAIAGAFFSALQARIPVPLVCEPRHADWFTPDADAWLADRRVARVAADPAKHPGAADPGGWRGLSYFRLHGSPRMYYSAYSPEVLAAAARRLREEAAKAPTWCVFDNTAGSAALPDALTVRTATGDERA